MSPPNMVDTDASATRPVKARNRFRDCIALSMGVGMMIGSLGRRVVGYLAK